MDSRTSNGISVTDSESRTDGIRTQTRDGFSNGARNGNVRRQGIFWLLTIPASNPVAQSVERGDLPSGVVWCKGQKERGVQNGFEHYQCVAAFGKKMSLSGVVGVFGRGTHGELSRSEAANDYVGKEETRIGEPFEFGAKPVRRNSKVDWENVWVAAQTGNLMEIPANIRVVSYRTIRAIGAAYTKPRAIERTIFVFWGRSGSGKSRRAWSEAGEDAYSKCPRSKFWDGYQGEGNVVVDEFRGGIDIAHLLRWMDRYPVRVDIKGSSTALVANKIWFTSNLPPSSWYPDLDVETLAALMRRMTVQEFT